MFGNGLVSVQQIGVVAVTLIMLGILTVFFRYTTLGLAMRAAAQNPSSARLMGVRVSWMLALGWGLAAAIGAVAGMLVAPIVFLDPNMMTGILVYGFAGALVGGIGNPVGAVAGGFIVGVLENLVGSYIIGNELKLTFALVIVVGVLLLKPAGHVRPRHRKAGLSMAAITDSWATPRGIGPDRDPVLGIAGRRCRSRDSFTDDPSFDYYMFMGQAMLIYAHRGAGPEPADRLQRPDLAGPQRVFRARRLHRRDPDELCAAGRTGRRCRWPRWLCFGAGFLFGFPALKLEGHYLALATFTLAIAVPQLLKYKAMRRLDRRCRRADPG